MTQLYANVSKHSKYADQATPKPFPVVFGTDDDGYIIHGNLDRYRVSDVVFYGKLNGEFYQIRTRSWEMLVRGVYEESEWFDENPPGDDPRLQKIASLLIELKSLISE